jgi:DNA-binding beta-propeller fold protein YncE
LRFFAVGKMRLMVPYWAKQNRATRGSGEKTDMHTRLALAAALLVTAPNLLQAQEKSGPATGKSPGWFLQGPQPARATAAPRVAGRANFASLNGSGVPGCSHSTVCDPANGGSADRAALARVQWRQTMGYAFSYPFAISPDDKGAYHSGVPAVGTDSKDNIWVFQRNAPGHPQLFKYGPDHRLILTVAENVLGHQEKAHGMAVDPFDNVWVADGDGSTVTELNSDGKVLRVIGRKGQRGDWNEAKGQRLLWQPMMMAFSRNGDVFIAEGHANESPNDADSTDPNNNIGAARIIHLDRSGKFIHQWFGNSVGQGKFSMAHGVAVDPRNGDVWIGDREQYRLVVYTKDGVFRRTIQMRNLICAIAFDPHGDLWVSSGQDGQLLKLDRDGTVLGAMGNGAGRGPGQAVETTYMAWDRQGNLYTGDTSVARVTEWSPPK